MIGALAGINAKSRVAEVTARMLTTPPAQLSLEKALARGRGTVGHGSLRIPDRRVNLEHR